MLQRGETLGQIVAAVLGSPLVGELIIVDDCSTDGTARRCSTTRRPTRPGRHATTVNQGKGAALRTGFAAATLPYVIVQDADLEYDPAEYPSCRPAARRQGRRRLRLALHGRRAPPCPVLLALRRQQVPHDGVEHGDEPEPHRHGDVLQGVPREVLEQFTIEENRFGVEPEITAKIARLGLVVYEVGISYDGRTYAEGKKIGWRDGVRAMFCIVAYSGPASGCT